MTLHGVCNYSVLSATYHERIPETIKSCIAIMIILVGVRHQSPDIVNGDVLAKD